MKTPATSHFWRNGFKITLILRYLELKWGDCKQGRSKRGWMHMHAFYMFCLRWSRCTTKKHNDCTPISQLTSSPLRLAPLANPQALDFLKGAGSSFKSNTCLFLAWPRATLWVKETLLGTCLSKRDTWAPWLLQRNFPEWEPFLFFSMLLIFLNRNASANVLSANNETLRTKKQTTGAVLVGGRMVSWDLKPCARNSPRMFSFLHFVSCFMVGKRDHLLVKDTFLGLLFPSGFFADLNPDFKLKTQRGGKSKP